MTLEVKFTGDIFIPPFEGDIPRGLPSVPSDEVMAMVRRFALITCENAVFTDSELQSHMKRNGVDIGRHVGPDRKFSEYSREILGTICAQEAEKARERGEAEPRYIEVVDKPSRVPLRGIYFPSKAKETWAKAGDGCAEPSQRNVEGDASHESLASQAMKPRLASPEQIAWTIIKQLRASEKPLNIERLHGALKKNSIALKEPLHETYRTLTEVRILRAYTADSKNGRTHWLRLDHPDERQNLAEIEQEPGGIRRMLEILYESRANR